jgi:hypothetical protein
MRVGDKGGANGANTKQKRARILGYCSLNSVPDIVIAFVASSIFAMGWVGFFGILIGLQVLYLLLWIKRIAWAWLIFWISARRKMTESLENFLYQQRFPRPPEYVGGIDDYFDKIAKDNGVSPLMRVKAATELGSLGGIGISGNALMLMQLRIAYEAALEKYELRFPPREPEDHED